MIKELRRRVLAIVLIFTICIGLFLPIKVQANDTTEKIPINAKTEETSINNTVEERIAVDDPDNGIYYISNITTIITIT